MEILITLWEATDFALLMIILSSLFSLQEEYRSKFGYVQLNKELV